MNVKFHIGHTHVKMTTRTVHNVLFVRYAFLPTEQAETYLKICILINHSSYNLSQLVWLEGKHDFRGNRDIQALNRQLPPII